MSTQLRQFISDPMLHRFNIDDYHRIIEAGVLKPQQHLELIDGVLCTMPPIGAEHASINNRINRLFSILVNDFAIVSVQNPLILQNHSEPEPDLMLLRPRDDFYEASHPTPNDTFIIARSKN